MQENKPTLVTSTLKMEEQYSSEMLATACPHPRGAKAKEQNQYNRYILRELLLTHLRNLPKVALIFLPPRSFRSHRVRITHAKTSEIQRHGSFSWHYLRNKFRKIRSHVIKRTDTQA
jgi:hypothetical protein